MQVSRDITEAHAFIFDLLSVSFAYPTEALYQSLMDGQYVKELEQHLASLPQEDRHHNRHANRHFMAIRKLESYPKNRGDHDYRDFESEYINLFEHGNELPPLHMNAHLYGGEEMQPVPVFQRLISIYRDFDVELTTSKATEQPDHLTVQLEFFAYLHRLLLEDNDERSLQKISNAIKDFCVELQWTRDWVEQLQSRNGHDFYRPLAQFLLLMLDSVHEHLHE